MTQGGTIKAYLVALGDEVLLDWLESGDTLGEAVGIDAACVENLCVVIE
jgi:hypothetical protein